MTTEQQSVADGEVELRLLREAVNQLRNEYFEQQRLCGAAKDKLYAAEDELGLAQGSAFLVVQVYGDMFLYGFRTRESSRIRHHLTMRLGSDSVFNLSYRALVGDPITLCLPIGEALTFTAPGDDFGDCVKVMFHIRAFVDRETAQEWMKNPRKEIRS